MDVCNSVAHRRSTCAAAIAGVVVPQHIDLQLLRQLPALHMCTCVDMPCKKFETSTFMLIVDSTEPSSANVHVSDCKTNTFMLIVGVTEPSSGNMHLKHVLRTG